MQACFHGDEDEVRAILHGKSEDVNYQVRALMVLQATIHLHALTVIQVTSCRWQLAAAFVVDDDSKNLEVGCN